MSITHTKTATGGVPPKVTDADWDAAHAGTLPAASVSVADSGSNFTGTDVEAVLAELAAGGPGGSSDAADIDIVDAGGYFTGTDVEAALQELGAGGGGVGGNAELDYVQITSPVTITGANEAGATTVVTGNPVTYDGSTEIILEFYCPYLAFGTSTTSILAWLYDGSTSIGAMGAMSGTAATEGIPFYARAKITPSAGSHTYGVRMSRDSGSASTANASAGGAGVYYPTFIRISRADGGSSSGSGGGGALVFLDEQVASSSAQLDFTGFITADYDEYLFEFVNLIPATDGVALYVRCSTNGGSSYDTSSVYTSIISYAYVTAAGASGNSVDSGSAFVPEDLVSNSISGGGVRMSMRLYDPASTTAYKAFTSHSVGWHQSLGKFVHYSSDGGYKSTTAVNAIRFLFSSGNIASGTIRVYGIAKTASSGGGSDDPVYPEVIQSASNEIAPATSMVITLPSAPTDTQRIILCAWAISGDITGVASTNTTWTKVRDGVYTTSMYSDIWVGVVAGTGGTAITVSRSGSNYIGGTAAVVDDLLTPTVSTSDSVGDSDVRNGALVAISGAGRVGAMFVASGGITDGTIRFSLHCSQPAYVVKATAEPLLIGYIQHAGELYTTCATGTSGADVVNNLVVLT